MVRASDLRLGGRWFCSRCSVESGQAAANLPLVTKQHNLILSKGGDALKLGRYLEAWQKVMAANLKMYD